MKRFNRGAKWEASYTRIRLAPKRARTKCYAQVPEGRVQSPESEKSGKKAPASRHTALYY